MELVVEEPPLFEDQEEILQPKSIIRHEDKILQSGNVIRRYLVKFKNLSFWRCFLDARHLVEGWFATCRWL